MDYINQPLFVPQHLHTLIILLKQNNAADLTPKSLPTHCTWERTLEICSSEGVPDDDNE